MSVKLMSAIFETEFHDLDYEKDGKTRIAKASTCKIVLLALADHANDYGESVYPGYKKMKIKTALSAQGLADTYAALEYNGLVVINRRGSRINTNQYTINIRSFPQMKEEADELPQLVKPLDNPLSSHWTTPCQATGQESSVNHQSTIPGADAPKRTPDPKKVRVAADKTVDAILEQERKAQEALTTGRSWKGRESLPEQMWPLADRCKAKFGTPAKRDLSGWLMEIGDWLRNGVTVADFDRAMEITRSWTVPANSPFSLSKTIKTEAQKRKAEEVQRLQQQTQREEREIHAVPNPNRTRPASLAPRRPVTPLRQTQE